MFCAEDHTLTESFAGDPGLALEAARTALLGQGFEILRVWESGLEARGPAMSSSKEPPLRGATEVSITVALSMIQLHARLGGVVRMKRFLYLLPAGMAAIFIATVGLTFSLRAMWVPAMALLPWLVLSPWIAGWIDRRTRAALDALVRSMKAVGEGAAQA
jgi:hypothetical protein